MRTRIAASYLATRLAMGRSAKAHAERRARLWRALRPTLRRTPALAAFAGRALHDVPVTDVSDLRQDYTRWNSLGCSHDEIHAAAQAAEAGRSGEVRPGVVAGYSTGSAGQRGVFLASAAERADYIGQALGRLLSPREVLRPQRVALILRANSQLYSDSQGGRLRFMYLSLQAGREETHRALAVFAPTILIAPAPRLLDLGAAAAEGSLVLGDLERLFYGAEPMGSAERSWLSATLGLRPDPIHQATEGFIAAACPRGALHLNEHSLEIELEPVPGVEAYRPILTDLQRTSQPIVRVRTDDLLEPDPTPCPCGYRGRVVRPVMGRVGELWRYPGRIVTPAQVAEALEALLPPPLAWQAIARRDRVELRLDPSTPQDARDGLASRLRQRLDLPVPVTISAAPPDPPDPKRRRVQATPGEHG